MPDEAQSINDGLAQNYRQDVRRIRLHKKLTQEELAFEAKLVTYVGGIERGRSNPSLLVMARLADVLSVCHLSVVEQKDLRLLGSPDERTWRDSSAD
jgi:transcriptional regulator with XRE-family HTH domain